MSLIMITTLVITLPASSSWIQNQLIIEMTYFQSIFKYIGMVPFSGKITIITVCHSYIYNFQLVIFHHTACDIISILHVFEANYLAVKDLFDNWQNPLHIQSVQNNPKTVVLYTGSVILVYHMTQFLID